ncbi:class I SAM-dependent methyltransferase [Amylibacter sp.]|jgi:SAM-dependent methyltransferase|nr:class I SAM-dependent methyltransferase [Amylibacter sp.]
MNISIINPKNNSPLTETDKGLVDPFGNIFPIINGVARISELENYTENFGMQWNSFDKTQLDNETDGLNLSRRRFFAATHWDQEDLSEKLILEVGSGAGRFSKVVLENTKAVLYSVDYSDAVTANYKNNNQIAPDRFHLFQASVYEMPFPDNSFDKVFCFGVLQHTPDFDASVKALIAKAKPGGEIAVDFYPIKGWWTKINAKYILRPITKKMSHKRLLKLIEKNVDWLMGAHYALHRIGLGFMTRFLPICNVKESFPKSLTKAQVREWTILDTFDQYSPEHDYPQRIADVVKMFERYGVKVTFSGFEKFGEGMTASVVRGTKKSIHKDQL